MRRQAPTLEKVWTVLDLIKWGSEYFRDKGIDSPRLTIELMLCHVLREQRIRLYTDFERPLSKEELAVLRGMVQRRVRREPLQYILGEADFYGIRFEVTPDVLIPRPETEILVDRAIRFCKGRGKTIGLDIGTGTGCIPVAIAVKVPASWWTALEISPGAAAVARRNAAAAGVGEQVHVVDVDVLREVPPGPFDIVTMNPPYIPAADVATLEDEVRDHEPHSALTDDADGLTFYRRMADVWKDLIAKDGIVMCEIGHGQSQHVRDLFAATGAQVDVIDDLAGIPRIVTVRHPDNVL
jgi:release factor glutamine methyltransferase